VSKDETTEDKILVAAEESFILEGYEGARMQTIANKAGINKAMLHYYFRSKELLFEKVFDLKVKYFFPELTGIFNQEKPFVDMMEEFVERYISFINQYPFIPFFIIRTINSPSKVAFIEKLPFKKPLAEMLFKSYARDKEKGIVRDVDPMQFMLSIIGMCMFPFLGRPIMEFAFDIKKDEFSKLMIQRIPELKLYIRTILTVE
jgi:TetR/AcrR family transcriptional regulator